LLASLHIELATGKFTGNTYRADYTLEFFAQLAAGAGWELSAPLGELARQEALLFTVRLPLQR
jgi:hypothetical protein